jgi:hypothetical protein
MEREDKRRVMRVLVAAWPNAELSDDSVALWYQRLERIPADAGMAVASLLVDELQWFPTISQFTDRYRDLLRNAQLEENFRELEAPQLSPEEQAANVERLKELLEQVGTRANIDPKWKGIPRRKRPRFIPPPCTEPDCSQCGTGPVVDRGGYNPAEVPS